MTSRDMPVSSPSVSHNTMARTRRFWLESVHEAAHEITIFLNHDDYNPHMFDFLRELFEDDVQVDDITWEVKNMIASLAATDPKILEGRILLKKAVLDRCDTIMRFIDMEFEKNGSMQDLSAETP